MRFIPALRPLPLTITQTAWNPISPSRLFHQSYWSQLPLARRGFVCAVRQFRPMPTSTLKSCVNCGHQVSESAIMCPKCGCGARGAVCLFCRRERPLESLGVGHGIITVYFCEECVQNRFSPPAGQTCNDCTARLPQKTGREILAARFPFEIVPLPIACPSCGSIRPYGEDTLRTCEICRLPVFAFQRRVRYFDSTGRVRHEFCQRPRTGCLVGLLFGLAFSGALVLLVFMA